MSEATPPAAAGQNVGIQCGYNFDKQPLFIMKYGAASPDNSYSIPLHEAEKIAIDIINTCYNVRLALVEAQNKQKAENPKIHVDSLIKGNHNGILRL